MTISGPFFSLTTFIKRFSFPIAVGVMFILLLQFFEVVIVSGNSMNPTLQNGQFLINIKRQKHYQQGDIIVFSPPQDLQARASRFIKRTIAVPGDTLSIRDDKVYLNGQILDEPYSVEASTRVENFPEVLVSNGQVIAFEGFSLSELPAYLKDSLAMLEPLPQEIILQSQKESLSYIGSLKLDDGFYFVLGDNRGFSASEDSRLFGAIRAQSILGIAHSF